MLKYLLIGLAFIIALLFLPIIQVHAQVATITLDWTATGDDGTVGTATSYQMRWSSTRPDTTSTTTMDNWWSAATVITGLPVPLIAGTSQNFAAPGPFTTGQTYYFVMKTCDEVPNCSLYSNVASKFLPDTLSPSRIIDLRVR